MNFSISHSLTPRTTWPLTHRQAPALIRQPQFSGNVDESRQIEINALLNKIGFPLPQGPKVDKAYERFDTALTERINADLEFHGDKDLGQAASDFIDDRLSNLNCTPAKKDSLFKLLTKNTVMDVVGEALGLKRLMKNRNGDNLADVRQGMMADALEALIHAQYINADRNMQTVRIALYPIFEQIMAKVQEKGEKRVADQPKQYLQLRF